MSRLACAGYKLMNSIRLSLRWLYAIISLRIRAARHKPTHSVGMLKQPIRIFVHKLAYEQKSASAAFYKSGFATFRLMAE